MPDSWSTPSSGGSAADRPEPTPAPFAPMQQQVGAPAAALPAPPAAQGWSPAPGAPAGGFPSGALPPGAAPWGPPPGQVRDGNLTDIGRLIGAGALDYVLQMISWLLLGLPWLIWAAVTAGQAQTPGKRLLKMRVVDATTGQPLSWARYVFLRGLVGGMIGAVAAVLTLGVLAFMPLWDSRNQSIAAKVSNSVVVDV
jgi:uncharacterized RDD family membrane protein YckC